MKRLVPLLWLTLAIAAGAEEARPCVFCEIAAGTRQSGSVVYRDGQCAAFMSLGQRTPGHVLVVPLKHADNFLEVPADTMHAMTDAAKKIIEAIRRTDLKCEGFVLQMNSGAAAGQTVFHAHLHIIPRFTGDGLAPAKKAEETTVPVTVLEPLAVKIRGALALPASAATAPTASLELPAINEEVPLERIKVICELYGLHALWRKIERDPPVRPFMSDGCTGWFDDWKGVSLYPAGFFHDLKYWAGYPGEDVERLAADSELMMDVARLLGSTEMAETMFHGVRVGGSEKLKTPFAWGFGRQPLPAKPKG